MRYPASEKLEIIRLFETSHQLLKKTLEQIGVSRPTFYRWYDLYRRFGEAVLADQRGGSGRVWNRIPNDVREPVLEMALDEPELSPRELVIKFTDERCYFVSEASVHRLLKACDLIAMTGHAFQVFLEEDDVLAVFATMREHLAENGTVAFESRNPNIDWSARWEGNTKIRSGDRSPSANPAPFYGRMESASPSKRIITYPEKR